MKWKEITQEVQRRRVRVKPEYPHAETTMNIFLEVLNEALERGEHIYLPRIGYFHTKVARGRMLKTPFTNGVMKIKTKRMPKFYFYNGLRDRIASIRQVAKR